MVAVDAVRTKKYFDSSPASRTSGAVEKNRIIIVQIFHQCIASLLSMKATENASSSSQSQPFEKDDDVFDDSAASPTTSTNRARANKQASATSATAERLTRVSLVDRFRSKKEGRHGVERLFKSDSFNAVQRSKSMTR